MKLLIIFFLLFVFLNNCYSQNSNIYCDTTIFHSNGQTKELKVFKNGICKTESWYENGAAKSYYHEKDGIIIGKSGMFCENGNVMYAFDNDTDTITSYVVLYCNGDTSISAYYFNNPGCFVGKYKSFHENGVVKTEGKYKVSLSCEGSNVKDGKWIYRNENGKITKEETYLDGSLYNLIIPD